MTSSYEFAYAMEELGVALVTGLVQAVPSGLFSIACYVLTSLALYTVAKRRGINHPWLSWVPVANVWILGSLSDQYRYVVKGQEKSKRKILLTLSILTAVLGIVVIGSVIGVVVEMVMGAAYSADADRILRDGVGSLFGVLGLSLPLFGLAIAQNVIYYMALYDVYSSCTPEYNVLFLVLSILFGVTKPFFLFFTRNKDDGMPPRREEPVYTTYQQPPQEPWEAIDRDYL